MRLLCHRGFWNNSKEKNSWATLTRALELGLGIETDVRDCNGDLVVSHDPPRQERALKLEDLLAYYTECGHRPCLALNIKADGLQGPLVESLQRHRIDNYFVFDMSVPDTLGYMHLQAPYAARISEYEKSNELAASAPWIWLDAFNSEWYSVELIRSWLDEGKSVAIVSPELHRRSHVALWSRLLSLQGEDRLFLCTDYVENAMEYFDVRKD